MTTPFSGQRQPPVDLPVNIVTSSNVSVASGLTTVLPAAGSTYNVAQYQSLKCKFACTQGGTLGFYEVRVKWFVDAAGQNEIMRETFVFQSGGSTVVGALMAHGPYLQLEIYNYDTFTDTVSLAVFGSTRDIPRSQFHSSQLSQTGGWGVDNVLAISSLSVGAGSTAQDGVINFYNGPAVIRIKCTAAGSIPAGCMELSVNAEPKSLFFATKHLSWTVPASGGFSATNQPLVAEFALPRRACSIQVDNTDTSSHTIAYTIFAREI